MISLHIIHALSFLVIFQSIQHYISIHLPYLCVEFKHSAPKPMPARVCVQNAVDKFANAFPYTLVSAIILASLALALLAMSRNS